MREGTHCLMVGDWPWGRGGNSDGWPPHLAESTVLGAHIISMCNFIKHKFIILSLVFFSYMYIRNVKVILYQIWNSTVNWLFMDSKKCIVRKWRIFQFIFHLLSGVIKLARCCSCGGSFNFVKLCLYSTSTSTKADVSLLCCLSSQPTNLQL